MCTVGQDGLTVFAIGAVGVVAARGHGRGVSVGVVGVGVGGRSWRGREGRRGGRRGRREPVIGAGPLGSGGGGGVGGRRRRGWGGGRRQRCWGRVPVGSRRPRSGRGQLRLCLDRAHQQLCGARPVHQLVLQVHGAGKRVTAAASRRPHPAN